MLVLVSANVREVERQVDKSRDTLSINSKNLNKFKENAAKTNTNGKSVVQIRSAFLSISYVSGNRLTFNVLQTIPHYLFY